MTTPLFNSLEFDSHRRTYSCGAGSLSYAAPGIQQEPSNAIAEEAKRIGAA